MIRLALTVVLALLISGCSRVSIQSYEDTTPKLDLRTFFNGTLHAHGILQNRKGMVTRKFSADIEARWEGNTGYLDEVFYFDDGETETRNWVLTLHEDGRVSGTAGDVVGEAEGQLAGAALHWTYTLEVPYKGDTLNVYIDDWLYLVNENRLLNKSLLKKFGFRVGELTLVIEKVNNAK